MLKVAGWPLATGEGDISTPETLTAYSVFLSVYSEQNPHINISSKVSFWTHKYRQNTSDREAIAISDSFRHKNEKAKNFHLLNPSGGEKNP